jgi:hypothetical protein
MIQLFHSWKALLISEAEKFVGSKCSEATTSRDGHKIRFPKLDITFSLDHHQSQSKAGFKCPIAVDLVVLGLETLAPHARIG